MVDPAREIPALVKKIRAGLASWQGTVRELGFDPEDLIEEIIADNKIFDGGKVIFDSDPRRTSGAGQGQDMPQTGNGGQNG
jgi:capsid protein